MSEEYLQGTSFKHHIITYVRMMVLQLLALGVVALTVGLTGIHLFRESAYSVTEAGSRLIIERITAYIEQTAKETGRTSADILSDDYIQSAINDTGLQMSMDVFLFGERKCIACSADAGIQPQAVVLPESIWIDVMDDGTYFSDVKGKLNPGGTKPVFCQGTLFFITENDGTETEYLLFTNTFSDKINRFIRIMIYAGSCSVVAMLAVYGIYVYRVVERERMLPIRQISEVMHMYALEDYSKTLDMNQFNTPVYREMVGSLNQIISNLKATSEQQAQFVSNVSHELRTPMTIISGYVDGILDGTVPKARRMEYLYIVSQEMQRLKILVSSMLNLTKYDNGTIQMKREPFKINDLFFHTILMFQNRLEKREIEVEGLDAEPVQIYGDRDLIGQVVYNLVENAVKFVDTGGTITIRMEENKDDTVFAIRNTGAGIPKEELSKVFGRFYKSDFSRSQDKTGLGIGLDLVRKILTLHKANIRVSSEENVFTEFTVTFPKKPQTEDAENESS